MIDPNELRRAHAARQRERYATDPEYRAKVNARNMVAQRRRRADPEYRKRCAERDHARQRARYAEDPVYRKKVLDHARRYKYGIDPATVEHIVQCEICGMGLTECAPNSQGRKTVRCFDHDHTTGKFRGIVCTHCNRGLGAFRDSPEFLARAVEYLRSRK